MIRTEIISRRRRFAAADAVGSPTPLSRHQRRAVLRRMDHLLVQLAGPLAVAADRIVHAPGKLLRPGLTFAAASLAAPHGDAAVSAAAAVEFLHCATLVHDDVIDDARERRGIATINAVEGMATAIVTGDLLIAAAHSAAAWVSPAAGALVMSTLAELCAGQAWENHHRFSTMTTVDDALSVARGKTGSLLRTACLLGAHASDLPPAVQTGLAEFGMAFGVALQIVDDVLDLVSSTELLGKPVGCDMPSGTMTVPLVLALRSCPELADLVRPGLDQLEQRRARTLVRRSGAIGAALAIADEQVRIAGDALRATRPAAGGMVDAVSIARLADWPRRYVRSAVPAKVVPELRRLVAPLEVNNQWSKS